MLDFLSENYIWFFVAAVVLLFALIGFIVEGKKKKNKEFKGESIKEETNNIESAAGLEINDIPVTETVNNASNEQTNPIEHLSEPQSIGETSPIEVAPNTQIEQQPTTPTAASENVIIGEPIEMKNEPVIPTAPESFYDEPLMPENNQEKPMSFEINPNENNINERQ